MNKILLCICVLVWLSCSALIAAPEKTTKVQKIDSTSGRTVYTFETITLPNDEDMGLLGGSFLYDYNDWLAVGVSTYGAVTGDRGGFITLGVSAELQQTINTLLSVKGGLYVGGGGGRGGPELQGGGLMLRPYLGLYIEQGSFQGLAAGISQVNFPNGNIRSTQAYVSYQQNFQALFGKGWLKKNAGHGSISARENELFLLAKNYSVNSNVLNTLNQPQHSSISLLGIEWNHYLDDNFFLKIESAGAMGGESRGYMQTLAGAGYRFKLTDSTFLKFTGQIGMAGGGDVSTGGGILVDSSIILQSYMTSDTFIALGAGYTSAPDGDFRATNLSLQFGTSFNFPKVRKGRYKRSDLVEYDNRHIRVRVTQQNYFEAAPDWRRHNADKNVNLLGVQLDYFISENFYATGQGIAAYRGEAGAYMAGLLGIGYYQPILNSSFYINVEGLIGAAGGGGLDVGAGLVYQANAGLGYHISDSFSIMAYMGRIDAYEGNFKADVLGVNLTLRTTIFDK